MGKFIRQSESGDYFLVPLDKKDSFIQDELNGQAHYADYIELDKLEVFDYIEHD